MQPRACAAVSARVNSCLGAPINAPQWRHVQASGPSRPAAPETAPEECWCRRRSRRRGDARLPRCDRPRNAGQTRRARSAARNKPAADDTLNHEVAGEAHDVRAGGIRPIDDRPQLGDPVERRSDVQVRENGHTQRPPRSPRPRQHDFVRRQAGRLEPDRPGAERQHDDAQRQGNASP